MDNIKVGIRVRPLLPRELEGGSHWVVSGNSIIQKGVSSASYSFDYVFDESVDTETIFSTLAFPTIHSVMEGFNGTIFAYGQTSSGKTYTMTGTPMDPGIVPQTLQEVFNYVDQHPEREFIIRVSYLEIYNESLMDLLNTSNRDLKIREDPHRNVTVHGLTEQAVTGPEEIAHLLIYGEKNRSIGETNMNERSSRSHTLFTMTVESRLREGEEEDDGTVRVATLNLVDLAGSERVSATGAEGIRFKEGTFINLSLLVLGNVISKLSEGHGAHIPFRDSKLTRILQPSLGGNAKTCIICAITPAEIGETHSTLKFASRAKKVKNRPVVNEVLVGEEALLKKLKSYEKENEALKKKLAQGLPEQEKQLLTEQLETSEKHKANLVAKIHSLEEIIVKSSSTVSDSAIKASKRRQTVCPGFLSRGVPFTAPQQSVAPAGPLSALKSEFTPRLQRRVTFASSPIMSPFLAHFDHGSFEKHLEDISPVVQEHHPTRFLSRPSFIPRNSAFLEDSEISTTSSIHAVSAVLVDSQVQTEDAMLGHAHLLSGSTTTAAMCDAECQTDTMTPPRTSPAPSVESIPCSSEPAGQCTMVSAECQTDAGPERSIAVGTEDTWSERGRQCAPTLVSAECQTVNEPSELSLDVCVGGTKPESWCSQTVRLAPCVGPSHHCGGALESSICIHRDETKKTVEKMENMQFEFDEAQVRAQEIQQRLDEVEQLLAVKESEVREAVVKKEAMATKLGDFEMASQAQEELLLMLQNRLKQANLKLQQAGEHTQKLEQALHESEHQSEEGSEQLLKRLTQAEEESELQRQAVSKLTTQLEQMREKVTEKEAESRAWEERVAGLSQQLKEEHSKLEEESEQAVKKLTTQLEQARQETAEKEAESRAWEERVTGLSQQLKEANSKLKEESRQAVSELTIQLEQAIAEKEAESRAWEERVAGLSQQLKERNSKLEESELQSQAVSKLTTQLDQARQETAEKEAESRAWEERAAGLSQQLRDASSKLEESELQKQAVSKLTNQLEQARQEIAEKEAESRAWEERVAGLSQQLKEKNNEDESEQEKQAMSELTTQLEQARQEIVEKEAETRVWEERATGLSQQMKEEHSKELELQRQAVSKLTTQLEQARQEIAEKEAESRAWEERAAGLSQQMKEERSKLKDESELQKQAENKLTTQLEQARQEIAEKEAESRAWEERAAGLSQQLKEERANLEEDSGQERRAVSELTTQLEQARQETAEKEAESRAWEERAAGLSQQLREANSKLKEESRQAVSELTTQLEQAIAEKEAESRAWEERAAGLSQQLKEEHSRIEEELELQKQAVSKLTTQLEQMTQKVTEKEAESRAWEERAAGLSQQLRDASSKLEEDSELQRQAVRELTTQLQQMRQETAEKEAESRAWEERAAGLSQQLKERNSKLEESELQKQAVSKLTTQLEQARQEATKKEAESRALEEKVTGLSRQLKEASSKLKERSSKLQRTTTTLQTVQSECATYKNMAEGYQEEYERATAKLYELAALEREFENRRVELEEEIDSLNKKLQEKDVETQSLTEKLSELTNKLQVMERDYEKRSTVETTEQQLREVRKENARLKTKLQGQAVRPSSESVSVVTDGSGFVTGLALQQLKHEKSLVVRENDQLKTRMQKIRGELMAEKEKINKEREESKRYRQERNIYRAKYCHYKTECKCGIVVADISKEDPVSSNIAPPSELPASTTHSFAQPPAHNIPLEKLPSPKPPRKSIFSVKPDRDLRPGRRFFPKATSVAEPVITKPTVARRDDVATNDPENREPPKQPGLVSGAVRQSNKFVWEQRLLETTKEAGPESQENCQHQ